MASSSSDEPALALPAPTTAVDALPYVDAQYNDPAMKRQVDALVEAEMQNFAPGDYLGHLPASYEPNFEVRAPAPTAARLAAAGSRPSHAARPRPQDHPLLQAEWMRVCDGQRMPSIDTSRYALEGPSQAKQADPTAWRRAVENAEAQLEHQGTR